MNTGGGKIRSMDELTQISGQFRKRGKILVHSTGIHHTRGKVSVFRLER